MLPLLENVQTALSNLAAPSCRERQTIGQDIFRTRYYYSSAKALEYYPSSKASSRALPACVCMSVCVCGIVHASVVSVYDANQQGHEVGVCQLLPKNLCVCVHVRVYERVCLHVWDNVCLFCMSDC